jgi:hypothetical protein
VSPALLALALAAALPPHRSAIIVGVNDPFDPSQAVLRYADDDAARYFELLGPQIDRVELLLVLDAESQRLYPEAAASAAVPDWPHLLDALSRSETAAAKARAEGRRTELYFVYTGHGRVHGGEGEVRLRGGALRRSDLIEKVLSSKAYDRIHLIVDACDAYHLVSARGDSEATTAFDAAFERFVERSSLDAFPSVGVVLSTRGAGAVHEWSRYQGGVFSHEVRSALSGAADVDRDGRIDYAELEAFVVAANQSVPELHGPKVFVRAPAIERGAALFGPSTDLAELELPSALAAHLWLEDDRGLRYAELNKAAGHALAVRLVPRPRYEVIDAGGRELMRIERPASGQVALLERAPSPGLVRALFGSGERGAAGPGEPPPIFDQPLGADFVEGFRAHLLNAEASSSVGLARSGSGPPWLAYPAAGLALASGGAAIGFDVAMHGAYDRYARAYGAADEQRYRGDVVSARDRAIGFGVTAAVLALATAGLFVFGDP